MFNKNRARKRFELDAHASRTKKRAGCLERFSYAFAVAFAVYVLLAYIFCWFPFNLTSVCRSIPF